jgi:LDH2 family malate/lactate/ureidoglycolate dehydrogenase
MSDRVLPAERLKKLILEIFRRSGMSDEHAQTVAEVLVWADLRGMGSHGVMRVPRYAEWIRTGDLNAKPSIKASMDGPACVLLDVDRAAGPVAMVHAARAAVAKAQAAGIGLAVARATTHTAALGYYTQMAAREGFAAIAVAASVPNMAYHGARAAGVSTAPLSIAVPGGEEPLTLDMGSGVISVGKLMQARRSGEPLAAGLALDASGAPATDARAAAIPLPLGGPKGSGLALLIECLASLLAANPILAEALEHTEAGARHRQNGLVIAIDVERFVPLGRFRGEVARLARDLKALPAQPGSEILLPGERGARSAAARERSGVPLPAKVFEELRALAVSLGVEVPA